MICKYGLCQTLIRYSAFTDLSIVHRPSIPIRLSLKSNDPLVIVWAPNTEHEPTEQELVEFVEYLQSVSGTIEEHFPTRIVTLIVVKRKVDSIIPHEALLKTLCNRVWIRYVDGNRLSALTARSKLEEGHIVEASAIAE